MAQDLKHRVARTIKWNIIDRVASQVLYAVTGIVLARVLSQSDFGLVGAILVFQAFALVFVDSGFSSALVQRKDPDEKDYSTVFWFNLGIAVVLYGMLWLMAPWIASLFQNDARLIPLARVMFLAIVINATAIVQTNRLMKQMDVRLVAVSNALGLSLAAVVGIWMALAGFGAWAIVWQTLTLNAVKSLVLWFGTGWRPQLTFSMERLRGVFKVGIGVMGQSLLNTIFQNATSFFIGNRVNLTSLGYYTQADKWSKMGITSISQVLTSSFLAPLSNVQDDRERFLNQTSKMTALTSWILFPAMFVLAAMATPIFHALFSDKWDASIMLFRLLLLRGVFTVMTSLYNNFILALGRSRLLVRTEIVRDVVAVIAIVVTLPYIALSTDADPVEGVRIFVWGQVAASAITWAYTLWLTSRTTGLSIGRMLAEPLPYLLTAAITAAAVWALSLIPANVWLILALQTAATLVLYLPLIALTERHTSTVIQSDVLAYLRGKPLA